MGTCAGLLAHELRADFTSAYEKRAVRFLKRHPELTGQYEKALRILELNPAHPSLRLHRLKGRLADLHNISIALNYRITLEFLMDGQKILLVSVGSHDEGYRP